ncbi:larval cuticle protein 1-like [Leguminivora glycinivorella]|uniref:larval cuticle protein 1-like n=1 Tax=Leguminivora glycinivorella TaxID=1035111 RepID=UPI00200DE1F2|nr:larval cuticle protein 1-like [Leguminivora glycinivorella]
MKLVVLTVAALLAVAFAAPPVAFAAPPVEQQVVEILRSDFNQSPDGAYNYAVETQDGVKKEETGEIKVVNDEENKPHNVVVVRGSYSYTDKEGGPHQVTYVADENGYQPQSDDIPKAPHAKDLDVKH